MGLFYFILLVKFIGMRKFLLLTVLITSIGCTKKSDNQNNSHETRPVSEMTDQELKEFTNEIAREVIIADGHVDLPYRMEVAGFMIRKEIMDVSVRTEDGNFDYPRAKEGGLDAPFMSIYVPASYQKTGGAKEFADSLITMVEKITVQYPDKFAMAYKPEDIIENFRLGLVSLPMGMENGAPIGKNIENVDYFYNRGIRYITLTHSKDNLICDSSYDTTRTWNGLSPFGAEVVKRMNQTGIMIDISHVSDSAFYDVMQITNVPVIASHSSCRNFTPGFERNMSDAMIKALAKNGGVININFGSSFLDGESRAAFNEIREHIVNWLAENDLKRSDPEARIYIEKYYEKKNPFSTVEKVADHIDHVRDLVGIDHIGFGSDFDGVGNSLPIGLKDVSQYPNLIYELIKRGYSREDLEKICHKNLFRVWDEVRKYARNT